MAEGGVVITLDTLRPNLRIGPARVEDAIIATVGRSSPLTEEYARINAPWHDDTGNARAGLHTTEEHRPGKHSIVLAHTMSYGIWLEVRWGGRYEVILPTIRRMGHETMRMLGRLMEEL